MGNQYVKHMKARKQELQTKQTSLKQQQQPLLQQLLQLNKYTGSHLDTNLNNTNKCCLHHQNPFSEDWDGMSQFSNLERITWWLICLFLLHSTIQLQQLLNQQSLVNNPPAQLDFTRSHARMIVAHYGFCVISMFDKSIDNRKTLR